MLSLEVLKIDDNSVILNSLNRCLKIRVLHKYNNNNNIYIYIYISVKGVKGVKGEIFFYSKKSFFEKSPKKKFFSIYTLMGCSPLTALTARCKLLIYKAKVVLRVNRFSLNTSIKKCYNLLKLFLFG